MRPKVMGTWPGTGREGPDIYWWVENNRFLLVYNIWVYRRREKRAWKNGQHLDGRDTEVTIMTMIDSYWAGPECQTVHHALGRTDFSNPHMENSRKYSLSSSSHYRKTKAQRSKWLLHTSVPKVRWGWHLNPAVWLWNPPLPSPSIAGEDIWARHSLDIALKMLIWH